ncbi:MAG: hypothetical protein GF310_02050 [candidate division Zixibacteria bacterium]|nr:hypothetical protein [candidate division Zixibacteria bacterium]
MILYGKGGISSILALIFIFSILFACGGGEEEAAVEQPNFELTEFFPESFADTEINRSSEVEVYEGQSLYEYINGGAELYHLYNFEKVATAGYKKGENEIVMDIYQFDTPRNAYGLYSRVRPPAEEVLALGVEGFGGAGSLDFVKGRYVVRLTGFDQSDETQVMIDTMAQRMAATMPGITDKPDGFSLFPFQNMVEGSDVVYADSYLGHSFLTEVFERKYTFAGDTLTLFYTDDASGKTYLLWAEEVVDRAEDFDLSDLPFDYGKSFVVKHDFYGNILAGLNEGKLLGVINYGRRYMNFVSDWLEQLSAETE